MGERRSVVAGLGLRAVGAPVVALLGVVSTTIVVRHTDTQAFGVVSTIAAIALLLPFADLGIGAAVTTATTRWTDGAMSTSRFRQTLTRALSVLSVVTVVIWIAAGAAWATDAWAFLFDGAVDQTESAPLSIAVAVFGLAVPLGIGNRLLTGMGKNHVAVGITLSASVFTLAGTSVLAVAGADDLVFAIPPVAGLAASAAVSMIVGVRTVTRMKPQRGTAADPVENPRLLAGSTAMFVISVGLPIGLQWGRLVVARNGDAGQLAAYGLAAQFYAIGWTVVSTAGSAMWPVFVRRRGAAGATLLLWRRSLALFATAGAVLGALLAAAAPLAGEVISGGSIAIPPSLSIMYGLLLVVQSAHLPTGSLLTTPDELRWQALCVVCMALMSAVLTIALVPYTGAAGAVAASAVAVLVAQVIPDLVVVRSKVSARK
ncbi:MAG: oligosaccharide flippase family protein [Gordonia polyisoprenivorans]|nr:oligosaccharide flippase family protein [Gordonia polyisoprenivorans]